MDSTFILENFLLSRSRIGAAVTAEQFRKELPSDIPPEVGEKIYKELAKQREDLIEPVKGRIKEEFDIPIETLESSTVLNSPNGKYSIEQLVEDMNQLEKQLDTSRTSLDKEINGELAAIKAIIDELNDLKYGKSWIRGGSSSDVDVVVDETIKSIEKCETFLEK